MFQIQQLDHVALTVRNVERSVQWYQQVLGLVRLHEDVWGSFPAVLERGGTSLALFPVASDNPAGPFGPETICVRHIAFRTDRDNFDRARSELSANGITLRYEDHDIAHSIYFTDPDGHQVEITTYGAEEVEPVISPRGWRRSARWFLAEFLVVVSGILVALALQAWYNGRQDAAAERAYVAQLDADLAATAQALEDALRSDSIILAANASLVRALYRPGPLSADSARSWLRWQLGWYSDPRPLLGTVTTLIETGDIKLIRDARLRSQIVAYASLMATDMEELSRNVTRNALANDTERVLHERHRLGPLVATGAGQFRIQGTNSDDDVAAFLPGYIATWPALQADPDLRASNQTRLRSFRNRVFYLDRMIASTNELRARLKAAT